MSQHPFVSVSFVLSFLFCGFLEAQVPKDFYKSGFPASTGTAEPGVKGREDIDFFTPTSYYDTAYDMQAVFPFEKVMRFRVERVTVNGKDVGDFVVFNNHVYHRFKLAKGKDDLVIACMARWEFDASYTVEAFGKTEDGKEVALSVTARSPIKNAAFRMKNAKFGMPYMIAQLDPDEVGFTNVKEVFVDGLPVKRFEYRAHTLYVPLNWRTNSVYNVTLKSGRESYAFKAIALQQKMSFGYPDGRFPFYDLTYTFRKEEVRPFTLMKISVNGREVRDFSISGIDDDRIAMEGYQRRYPQYGKKITGKAGVSVKVRCDWTKDETYRLSVEGEDENGQSVVLEATGMAEGRFGFWNPDWKYYATVVLRESEGIRRVQEPVHIKMALYADRLTDPAREIRVVEFDPYRMNQPEGPYTEVPSQVYHVHTWDDRGLVNKEEIDKESGTRIVRYLPTTTLEMAFFADVYPYSEKVYLVFYGNARAKPPTYVTDLRVSGPEIGQVVENDQMRVDLDDSSGAIFGVFLKQGKDILLEHRLETNGAVHWNPGAYSPPYAWVHASDWKSPHFEQVSGPVFHMTERWAPLPHFDDVMVTITYVFYAGKPYIISSSITEVLKDFYGKALRNGEIVFNHEAFNTFAHKTLMGDIEEIAIETSLKHPEHVVDIPYDVPWVAFSNQEKKIGFGAIALTLTNTNKYGGLSDAEQPYYYVANGPWIYFSRALNYSFGSNNTSRMIRCVAGSLYYEKTAFLPFVMGESQPDNYGIVEEYDALLRHPLHASYSLDTDNRNNPGWVVPILVEPFDEGVEGAVGKKEQKE